MSLVPRFSRMLFVPLAFGSLPVLAEPAITLDKMMVTSTRSATAVEDTPQVVTVITREQIEQQLSLTSDTSQILSNLLPAFSPGRQKLSGSGETFRGRAPLFMVNGVPQSNPLRDSQRDGHTIDMAMIERIEVIHGANAIHGLGATGGIINFITRRPSGGTLQQHVSVQGTTPTSELQGDALGYKLNYRLEGTQDRFEYLLATSYEKQGVYLDANGTPIGVDVVQGELMDSQSYDLFAKLGYWIDDNQSVELDINRFETRGDNNYVAVNGDRDQGIPTTAVKGRSEGEAPRNRVLTANVKYEHSDLLGMTLSAQAYSQQFEALFGATNSGTFQDAQIAPVGTLIDQSQNESDKLGAKFTLSRDGLLNDILKLTGGLDLLRDTTQQRLTMTGRSWVPETAYYNYAPFLQAELRPLDWVILNTGVRYEYAELDAKTFQTLASANGVTVQGGTPSFDETLFNVGGVIKPLDWFSLFANYAQGFGMPDVGRVLRGINKPDQDVDDFLNLSPIVTDNQEIGIRIDYQPVDLELSYYQSDSDLGSRLQNIGGIFFVQREKTEINGFEATLGIQAHTQHRLEFAYSHIQGEFDSDEDGKVDTKLDALNIPPNRLLTSWAANWTTNMHTKLQASHAFDRSFDDPALEFDGYTLVDAVLGYKLPVGQLDVAVANLFNEDYFSYHAQSGSVRDDQNFKGRGRTLTLGYGLSF